MNHPIKLFFDNTFSKRLPKVIFSVYGEDYPDLQTKHLVDFFDPDDQDEDWLPLLEQDKDWIVITSDRGKDPKKQKLPLICLQLKITHVLLTSSLNRAGYPAHRHALLSLFPQFVCLGLLPKGTRITMRFVPYHQRNWPHLYVDGHPLDAWCLENEINIPGLPQISN